MSGQFRDGANVEDGSGFNVFGAEQGDEAREGIVRGTGVETLISEV
jgi:hypothetical protein